MRAVVQRVKSASVTVRGEEISKILNGFLVLIGISKDDTEDDVKLLSKKIANLRIFEDADNKMNRSLKDVGGQALIVSQFTLYGDVRFGNRPSFDKAASKQKAEELYNLFCNLLSQEIGETKVKKGIFGEMMDVSLVNYGPVTIIIDTKEV